MMKMLVALALLQTRLHSWTCPMAITIWDSRHLNCVFVRVSFSRQLLSRLPRQQSVMQQMLEREDMHLLRTGMYGESTSSKHFRSRRICSRRAQFWPMSFLRQTLTVKNSFFSRLNSEKPFFSAFPSFFFSAVISMKYSSLRTRSTDEYSSQKCFSFLFAPNSSYSFLRRTRLRVRVSSFSSTLVPSAYSSRRGSFTQTISMAGLSSSSSFFIFSRRARSSMRRDLWSVRRTNSEELSELMSLRTLRAETLNLILSSESTQRQTLERQSLRNLRMLLWIFTQHSDSHCSFSVRLTANLQNQRLILLQSAQQHTQITIFRFIAASPSWQTFPNSSDSTPTSSTYSTSNTLKLPTQDLDSQEALLLNTRTCPSKWNESRYSRIRLPPTNTSPSPPLPISSLTFPSLPFTRSSSLSSMHDPLPSRRKTSFSSVFAAEGQKQEKCSGCSRHPSFLISSLTISLVLAQAWGGRMSMFDPVSKKSEQEGPSAASCPQMLTFSSWMRHSSLRWVTASSWLMNCPGTCPRKSRFYLQPRYKAKECRLMLCFQSKVLIIFLPADAPPSPKMPIAPNDYIPEA